MPRSDILVVRKSGIHAKEPPTGCVGARGSTPSSRREVKGNSEIVAGVCRTRLRRVGKGERLWNAPLGVL